jgi:hypothetical protein
MVSFIRNYCDLTLLVYRPNAFHRANACRGIAYDNVLQCIYPLSSKTIALFGQPFTQAGVPEAVLTHSSHFCTAPSSDGETAPYGQLIMQVKQLTHLSLLIVITPSAIVKAPVMQPLTQYGSLQCRHETAKLMSSFFSM